MHQESLFVCGIIFCFLILSLDNVLNFMHLFVLGEFVCDKILHMYLMAALNSQASILYLWSTRLSDLCHHRQVMFLLGKKKSEKTY